MKPIALLAYPIMTQALQLHHPRPFRRQRFTLIACEQSTGLCYTIELDEKYCDVICNRFIAEAGNSDGVFLIRDDIEYKYRDVPGVSTDE